MYYFSPMEQYEIYSILSYNLQINNVVFYLLIATFISIFITSFTSKGEIISNWMSILNECFYRTILSIIIQNLGRNNTVYLPLFYSLFFIIFFSNMLGLIPYSSTPTVEMVMTLSMSFTMLLGILIIGAFKHKQYVVAVFIPSGVPLGLVPIMLFLETLAYLIKIISLGLRLAINLTTGHILVKVSVGFIYEGYGAGTSLLILLCPMILLTAFICLEILIAYLQAFIFTFISTISIKDFV